MFVPTSDYLGTLPVFALFFAVAIGLLALFALVYTFVTPYPEFKLIRQGNSAAAISLSGAMLGFALPLAGVIENSVNLMDMLVWGLVALVVQILAFVAARLVLPDLIRQIEDAQTGPAIVVGGFSVVVGLLNAACVTY
ncbi:MAG: DUF350 domain-containing protein [Alphaproteobacteria bacterium]